MRGAHNLPSCLLTLLIAAGCGSDVSLTADRDGFTLAFDGCNAVYSGHLPGSAPISIDLVCPRELLWKTGQTTLHLSTPLSLLPNGLNVPQPIQDDNFGKAGAQLGHFVGITYAQGGKVVQCTPKAAVGRVLYTAIPSPQQGGRYSGRFSEDAALRSCATVPAEPNGTPVPIAGELRLRGGFDIALPALPR